LAAIARNDNKLPNMKAFLFISAAFVITLASCHKDAAIGPGNITGNWSVVSDSSYSSGIGPYGTPSSHKYVGVGGDHFDFTSAGKLYIKEGNIKLDTADYTIAGTDTLKLKYDYLYEGGVTITGASGSYIIATLNSQSLVLTYFGATPGGIFSERIDLSR
jgi:hypothetical protein